MYSSTSRMSCPAWGENHRIYDARSPSEFGPRVTLSITNLQSTSRYGYNHAERKQDGERLLRRELTGTLYRPTRTKSGLKLELHHDIVL